MNNKVPIVILTDISDRISYYHWFILGLMELAKSKQIILKYKLPFLQRSLLSSWLMIPAHILLELKRRYLARRNMANPKIRSILRGYIIYGKVKKSFCIDSADSPFLFSGKELQSRDIYFKMQCPTEFNQEGFDLGNVKIPWTDYEYKDGQNLYCIHAPRKTCEAVITFKNKIKPLLVATRRLCDRGCEYKRLKAGYENLISSCNDTKVSIKSKKLMCYFGNSMGPRPSDLTNDPDYDWEADILKFFEGKINHPNEKRAIIAETISALGPDCDARIISRGFSDTGAVPNKSLEIPLSEFSKHVSQFQYNCNVSGYRMSIPNRFMDSFVCGTAIVTDNLHVKWYVPFGPEVIEIGEMGYLPLECIDYEDIKLKLESLPEIKSDLILKKFHETYAPVPVARYIVNTVLEQNVV